jgi:hypothetical protein
MLCRILQHDDNPFQVGSVGTMWPDLDQIAHSVSLADLSSKLPFNPPIIANTLLHIGTFILEPLLLVQFIDLFLRQESTGDMVYLPTAVRAFLRALRSGAGLLLAVWAGELLAGLPLLFK